MAGIHEVFMRAIGIVFLLFGMSATALASEQVNYDFMPPAQAAKVGCRGQVMGTPEARKPIKLPIALSRIREIQDARDKRTGVKTKHVVITDKRAVENLEPLGGYRCGDGIKRGSHPLET